MAEYDENPDRAIGDAPELGDESVDVTPDEAVHAESFDFEAWLSGARLVRRAVKLNPRGDLVAVMEEAAERYAEGDDAALEDFEAAKAQFHAASRWFVVEAISAEAVERIHEQAAKDAGVSVEELQESDPAELMFAQIAAQVVTPEGVTADALRRLDDVAPAESRKLLAAARTANTTSATLVQVASPDFSPRR